MIFDSKVIALVAVRLKSKRLKKKAFCSLYGKKVIERLTERLKHSKYLDDIICIIKTIIYLEFHR